MVTPMAGVYGWLWFGQCSVVSFVFKKLFVYLFMVKLYIFSYEDALHWNILSPFMKISEFLLTLHATIAKFWEDSKNQD